MFYSASAETVLKADASNLTGLIEISVTKALSPLFVAASAVVRSESRRSEAADQPARRARSTYEDMFATPACCLAPDAVPSNSMRRSNNVERKNV